MHIKEVKMIVTLDSGESFTLVERDPSPTGDNPRFLMYQYMNAIRYFMLTGLRTLEAISPNQMVPEKSQFYMDQIRERFEDRRGNL